MVFETIAFADFAIRAGDPAYQREKSLGPAGPGPSLLLDGGYAPLPWAWSGRVSQA